MSEKFKVNNFCFKGVKRRVMNGALTFSVTLRFLKLKEWKCSILLECLVAKYSKDPGRAVEKFRMERLLLSIPFCWKCWWNPQGILWLPIKWMQRIFESLPYNLKLDHTWYTILVLFEYPKINCFLKDRVNIDLIQNQNFQEIRNPWNGRFTHKTARLDFGM